VKIGSSSSAFSQKFGMLSLSGKVSLYFNSLGASCLAFTDSSSATWTGKLILKNFTVGSDSLNFGRSTGLTASQLSHIVLEGYTDNGYTASLDNNGNLIFTRLQGRRP
jgi:hypothetical protein